MPPLQYKRLYLLNKINKYKKSYTYSITEKYHITNKIKNKEI